MAVLGQADITILFEDLPFQYSILYICDFFVVVGKKRGGETAF